VATIAIGQMPPPPRSYDGRLLAWGYRALVVAIAYLFVADQPGDE